MENSKVSVITPTYNCGKYLGETIDSVLSQTYSDIELLLVDDCSTDGTKDVVAHYLKSNRIKYFLQKNNIGQAAARNIGLANATGKYVAYLDADDIWHPMKLEKQINLMQKTKANVCYSKSHNIDEAGHFLEAYDALYDRIGYMLPRRGKVTKYLFYDNFVPFSSVLVEKSLLSEVGGSNQKYRRADDWELLLRLSVKGVFDFVPERLIYYRCSRKGQLSADPKARFEAQMKIASSFIDKYPGVLTDSEIKKANAHRLSEYAYAISENHPLRSIKYYLSSLKVDPIEIVPLKGILKASFLYIFKSKHS